MKYARKILEKSILTQKYKHIAYAYYELVRA